MASRTDSVTIHDIRQIFRRYDANVSFQTVLDNEDVFNRICNTILRPIYRYASQSKASQHSRSPPRKRRIQEIAAEEGISPELPPSPETSRSSEQRTQELLSTPDDQTLGTSSSEQNGTQKPTSTPKHTTASETSEQRVTQDCAERPEHNTTLEYNQTLQTSLSQAQNAIQESTETPEHNQTQQTPLSPPQNITQERTETPVYNQTQQTSLLPPQNITQERTKTPEHSQTQQTPLSPPQNITQERTETPVYNQIQQTSLSPPQNITQERTETPELTSILDDALDASTPKSFLPNSKPILDPALDSAIELSDAPPPPYSPQAEGSATVEQPDSGIELSDNIADEDLAPPNSPQIEISATTEQDQTNQGHQAITENQKTVSTSPYKDRLSTMNISVNFDSWIRDPKENFWAKKSTLGLKEEGDANTRLKFFIQNAFTKNSEVNIQKLQYRFTSILVYQSFQKMMDTERINSGLIQQYLERIGMPLKHQSDCELLIYGGKNRIDFDRRITPDRDEIDHGPQCLTELNDNLWDYIKDSRIRAKAEKTIAKLKAEDIASWSKKSRAQSAAKRILLYGQKLLDLEDFQNKRKSQKRKVDIIDQTSLSNVYTMEKRIRTGFQNSRPNKTQNMTTPQPSSPYIHANPAVFQAELRDSPLDLQSNGQGLETLAQVALTNIPSEEATNFISNEDTIHSKSASYRENALNNGASSQPNDNPPLETNDDIQNLSSYQDNTATGDFHKQCHTSWQARAVEENDDDVYNSDINWEFLFRTIDDDFDWGTVTLE